MTGRECVFLLSLYMAVSGGCGEVSLWVAEGLIIILTVRKCRVAWISCMELSGNRGGI